MPDLPLPLAEAISFWSNWALLAALLAGVIATYAIVVSANSKERHWDEERRAANERISGNEKETVLAKADLARSGEQVAALLVQAEQLRKDTAQANAKLESERIERLELEARLAPRILSDSQSAQLSVAVASLKGMVVDVVSYEAMGTDVAVLSRQISKALTAAGLTAPVFSPLTTGGLVRPILVRTEKDSPIDTERAASLIVAALSSVGLAAIRWESYPAGEGVSGGFMAEQGVSPVGKIRILVGAKP